ncbi:unnamed protein product [Camellia sinensis]
MNNYIKQRVVIALEIKQVNHSRSTIPKLERRIFTDVPRSAARKAGRGMPTLVYFFSVSKTTFRGHLLGVAASWLVQVGVDIYRYFTEIFKAENDKVVRAEKTRVLGKKVSCTTARCGAALVFASVGAGIGATLLSPSTGQLCSWRFRLACDFIILL